MRLGNTSQSWGLVARGLHWLVALLIVGQFATGWLSEAADDRATSFVLIRNHYQFGVILSGLILLRLLWRLSNKAPEPLAGEPVWRERSARTVHVLMYGLLIVLPITGYIIWIHMKAEMSVFGLFSAPRLFTPPVEDETLRAGAWYVHYFAGWFLVGLVGLHVLAALWHQFVRRDGLLGRMTTNR